MQYKHQRVILCLYTYLLFLFEIFISVCLFSGSIVAWKLLRDDAHTLLEIYIRICHRRTQENKEKIPR